MRCVRLITDATASTTPPAWQLVEHLATTSPEDAGRKLTALRDASASERQLARTFGPRWPRPRQAARTGPGVYEHQWRQQCPVCGQGSLDSRWAGAAGLPWDAS